MNFSRSFALLDTRIVEFMQERGLPLLRFALGIVCIWFGALQLLGMSPAADLVRATIPFFNPTVFVPILGIWEMVIGIGFFFRKALRVTFFLFLIQMLGTFLLPIVRPDLAFQNGNPLALTLIGEFVMKNLVLLAAGLVVGSTIRSRSRNT